MAAAAPGGWRQEVATLPLAAGVRAQLLGLGFSHAADLRALTAAELAQREPLALRCGPLALRICGCGRTHAHAAHALRPCAQRPASASRTRRRRCAPRGAGTLTPGTSQARCGKDVRRGSRDRDALPRPFVNRFSHTCAPAAAVRASELLQADEERIQTLSRELDQVRTARGSVMAARRSALRHTRAPTLRDLLACCYCRRCCSAACRAGACSSSAACRAWARRSSGEQRPTPWWARQLQSSTPFSGAGRQLYTEPRGGRRCRRRRCAANLAAEL